MLRLADVEPEREFARCVGEYQPIDIQTIPGRMSIDDIFFWRATASDYLLEIKLVAASGAVAAMTLVLVPRDCLRIVDFVGVADTMPTRVGLPVFDLAPFKLKIGWREIGVDPALRRIDEARPLSFDIGMM